MASSQTESLIEMALAYAKRGWAVLPLHDVTKRQCSCKNGVACENPGKHPRNEHGVTDASKKPLQIRQWWKQWPAANIGIACGSAAGFFALDEDPDKGGMESLQKLEQEHGPLPATVRQNTGGEGTHYLFSTSEWPSNRVSILPGLDIRSTGGYIVAEPSGHISGGQYAWDVGAHPDDRLIAEAPEWLLTVITQARARQRVQFDAETTAIPKGGRNDTLFRHATSLRARGGNEQEILAYLHAINATRCQPPLSEDEVATITRSACQYAPGQFQQARNGHHAAWDVNTTPASDTLEPWKDQLLRKKNGEPLATLGNIGLILHNHPQWAGKFWWDAVRCTPMYDDTPLTKEFITEVAQWLSVYARMGVSTTRPVEECLIAECHLDARDLLQHWLNSLPVWDGVPRLNDWLIDVAGVEKDAYGMAISRVLPLSMVARAKEPGCLYRYVVILEGPENTGKSSLVRALAGPGWYVELSMGLESKEAHMMLQGAWLAEMAELDSLSRTEETRLKAFITLKEDTWIPKYSNFKVSNPRRTIFIGTTNEESYLKGQTGNTRFLPIKTGEIDIPLLLNMRDQLFAEAVHVYTSAPTTWWQFGPEADEAAKGEREKRRVVNVYEEPLEAWLQVGRFEDAHAIGPQSPDRYEPLENETTWAEIAVHFLKVPSPEKWKDMTLQKQIATAMKSLGWHNRVIWRDGKSTRIWEKEQNG